MRCDIARAMLENKEMFVFDEFTSVVDRDVAQIGSFALQKTVRRAGKKFVAVTCHFDVQDWLMPDWIFNTDTMQFQILDLETQKKIDQSSRSTCSRQRRNSITGEYLGSITI